MIEIDISLPCEQKNGNCYLFQRSSLILFRKHMIHLIGDNEIWLI